MSFKLLSICLTLILLYNIVVIDGKKCTDKDSTKADVCMSQMLMIGDRDQQFRETFENMQMYCKNITEQHECVKRYSRQCLPGFARQVSNLLVTGVTKANKPLCGTDAAKRAFTKVAKCGNININDKHKCMDQFVDDLKRTETETTNKKIPFFCCYFWKFKDCVKQTFVGIDGNRCPKPSIDSIMNLISGYASDALDLICADFDDGSAKCRQLMVGTSAGPAPKTGRKARPKAKSILPSFINIFTNL